MAYATPSDFESYTDESIENTLEKASVFIDGKLVGAVYETDENGVAVRPDIRDAIRQATLAQAAFWEDGYGSPNGAPIYSKVKIDTVELTNDGVSNRKEVLAPQAYELLRAVGLFPLHPRSKG